MGGTGGIRVEKVIPPKTDEDEDEDEECEMEVKNRTLIMGVLLGNIETRAKLGIQIKGKGEDKGKWFIGWRFNSCWDSWKF